MLCRLSQSQVTKTEKSHAEKTILENVALIISIADMQNIKLPRKCRANCAKLSREHCNKGLHVGRPKFNNALII